jgi:endonuclease-3
MPSRALEILSILKKTFPLELSEFASAWVWSRGEGPFAVLTVTILSQNSTDVAALRAYESLKKEVGISPHRIAASPLSKIESCIRVAGLYRNKARALKRLSKEILKHGCDYLEHLLTLPLPEARERLMALPQVGPKTADVFMAVMAKAPVLPVDTHVARVARRLGLAVRGRGYEAVRSSLESQVPPELRHEAHMLLITLGRRVCKSRAPLCYRCPVNQLCPYPSKTPAPPSRALDIHGRLEGLEGF